jgi:acyl-coenzyme A thioesterase PaaI-like protein
MIEQNAIQDSLHPDSPIRGCFGCGADNRHGLRLKSFVEGNRVIAHWRGQDFHQSYPGVLNGGIATALIDCHAAWTAFAQECRDKGLRMEAPPEELPAGWTRAISIEFLKPTRLDGELTLTGEVIKKGTKSRTVACSISMNGEECVRAEAVIVMVSP